MNWVATTSLRKRIIVGVADMVVTNDTTADLVTYSLGSCLGIAIYDPVKRVGGLLHSMLPESSLNEPKSKTSPYMFVDTGVPLLFRTAYQLGADRARIVLKVVGGAQIADEHNFFRIGSRNCEALHKIMERQGLKISMEEVGGRISRSIRLEIATGKLLLSAEGQPPIAL